MEKPGLIFFAESNIDVVNDLIIGHASSYSSSVAVIDRYVVQHSPERKAAMIKEVEDLDVYQGIKDVLGSQFGEAIVGEMLVDVTPIGGEEEKVSAEQLAEAWTLRTRSSSELTELVGYLQQNGHDRIVEFGLSDTADEAVEMSWRSVWARLIGTIKPIGGVVLADTADMFDGLVRMKYLDTFDPVDKLRGPEARADVSARTFYEIFAPHLSRAIMHSGEDNWTGH